MRRWVLTPTGSSRGLGVSLRERGELLAAEMARLQRARVAAEQQRRVRRTPFLSVTVEAPPSLYPNLEAGGPAAPSPRGGTPEAPGPGAGGGRSSSSGRSGGSRWESHDAGDAPELASQDLRQILALSAQGG